MRFICDRHFTAQAIRIFEHCDVPVPVSTVFAGKFRRYNGVSWWKQLLDIPTTLRNLGDIFLIGLGTIQSFVIVLGWKPDVIFTKGGFVCLPVGIVARLLNIPLVIHDSDAHPGLTNRILAKWATRIATGAPLENYPYPTMKSSYVGIPVDTHFHPYTPDEQLAAKSWLGMVDTTKPLVVVTGGGLGAKRINDAMTQIGEQLVADGASIYHISGEGQFSAVQRLAPETVDYMVVPFIADRMHDVLGAADVVVTRAGATTLLELAALAKSIIIVPNPLLTGGHQLKNATVYEAAKAAVIVDEADLATPQVLSDAISNLLAAPELRASYGSALHTFAKPDAAIDVAMLIIKAAANQTPRQRPAKREAD